MPQYLPAMPHDRYDGGPLKYCLVDDKPLLYSIGTDRNDDGGSEPEGPGRAIEWIPPDFVAAHPEGADVEIPGGDWIRWPPSED